VHPNRFRLALGAQLTAAVLDVSDELFLPSSFFRALSSELFLPSSFFFVSTEIAGWPAVCQALTRALM
jgi:hypothetical protein